MPEPRDAFADLERRLREASMYLDPVNRHRDAYLHGEISVEDLEDRIGAELGLAVYGHADVGALDEVDAAFTQANVVRLRKVENDG
jgi:hypothetical protein